MAFLAAALALALVGLAVWVRVAPSDPARWHVDPVVRTARGGYFVGPGGDAAPLPAGPDTLASLDAIALATPRTRRLAGGPDTGRITWITRSALWGFPDYTTAAVTGAPTAAVLTIYARQRFGSDDLGVNKARVTGWLAALSAQRGSGPSATP